MPNKNYYGQETLKAVENFGKGQLPFELILAYAEVKEACITAIQETKKGFKEAVFESLLSAVREVKEGIFSDQFPLNLKQGGAGTSINMNLNEVIAARAEEIVQTIQIDPIEDVNRFQSTNDTFSTTLTIVFLRKLNQLEDLSVSLQEILVQKESEYGELLLTGRTEMQTALPITLGQVFASWGGMIERDRWRLSKIKERFRTVALGGTAIGTCFSAPQNYIFSAEKHLRRITGLPLSRSQNLTDEIANADKFTELANGISQFTDNLFKMSGDLLLYTSSICGEIVHPNLQYGSTIMAAKINPVILELIRGLSIDASGECCKVREYSKNGQLQLNAFLPFLADAMLNAFDSAQKAGEALLKRFLPTFKLNKEKIEQNLVQSDVLLNALLPLLGYHQVKKIFENQGASKPSTLPELKIWIQDLTGIEPEKLEQALDPIHLTSSSGVN